MLYGRNSKKGQGRKGLNSSAKAKINWLTMGDDDTKFFHQSIKHKQRENTINVLHLGNEITSNQSKIKQIFQEYYTDLLCNDIKDRRLINMNIIQNSPVLTEDQQNLLTLSFSGEDIRKALWSILEDKAPGIDGFNSGFYKAAWPVIGTDVIGAVQEFFETRFLPQEWNETTITLIPKTQCPKGLGEQPSHLMLQYHL